MKREFKPTSDMVQAAKNVFTCMAIVETIRPVVEGYQKKILEKYEFPVLEKYKTRGMGEIVVRASDTYLMSDDNFKLYLAECNKERIEAGLHVDDPECCPLLVAENMLRKAKSVLIDAMEPITKIKADSIYNPEHSEQLVELTLRLLAPFVKEGKQ